MEPAPGETFHIPAHTIHAIGAGMVLCEIQQNSDITYRLYDYGRPRELHLERAMDVSIREPWFPTPAPPEFLARCPYYATRLMNVTEPITHVSDPARFEILIVLEGAGRIDGRSFQAGQAWHIPAGAPPFRIEPDTPARLLHTWVP